ncbi:hypothetical protein HD598_002211 [Neomicrococcus aestuarii]|uniref:N-acetyltransferase domain-containing protein n=1 Tax=Neomicrococcus aestuarii TaxID=556325 RepID=A0A7W8TVD5_9MICC|nr:hypothetical protein [Neomicrococcus aestuarii]MBB5513524.1 hypothetical protein [Neomicrococcus aestuarii]
MRLSASSRAVAALAWSRVLGLPDQSLHAGAMGEATEFISKPSRPGATRATFLQLMQSSALIAPQWFIDACENAPASEVSEPRLLVDMARHHGFHNARILTEEAIYFLDEVPHYGPPRGPEPNEVIVSLHVSDAERVEKASPVDDYVSVQPSTRDVQFTTISEDESTVWSTGAYDLWEGLVADIAVLTRPEVRLKGFGSFITGVAAEEALSDGLVPQLRVGMGNSAAMLLAESLGFELAGSVTSVFLGEPTTTQA